VRRILVSGLTAVKCFSQRSIGLCFVGGDSFLSRGGSMFFWRKWLYIWWKVGLLFFNICSGTSAECNSVYSCPGFLVSQVKRIDLSFLF